MSSRRVSPFTHDYLTGDLVLLRERFGLRTWLACHVSAVAPHEVSLDVAEGRRKGRTITLKLGGRGQIRKPGGSERGEVEARIDSAYCSLPAVGLPELRIIVYGPAAQAPPPPSLVVRSGHLRPVPKPQGPARSEVFRQYVRRHPCARCGAAGPSEAHHQGAHGIGQRCSDFLCVPLCHDCHGCYTDTGALPGLDRAASLVLLLLAHVDLLARWAEQRAAEQAALEAGVALVPILARLAS